MRAAVYGADELGVGAEDEDDPVVDIAFGGVSAFGCFPLSQQPPSRDDVALSFADPEEEWTKPSRRAFVAPILPKPDPTVFRITHNDALDFPNYAGADKDKLWRIRFNLSRTKVEFAAKRRSGRTFRPVGELIDVSIGSRHDPSVQHFFKDVGRHMATYRLRSASAGETLEFRAYSLHNIIYDLIVLLFEKNNAPWVDRKYTKRINRLSFLTFVEIFLLQSATTEEKLGVLQRLNDEVYAPMAEGKRVGSSTFKRITAWARSMHLDGVAEFIEHIGITEEEHVGNTEMATLAKVLRTNSEFLLSTIRKVNRLCAGGEARVEKEAVYRGRFALGGSV